MEHYQDYGSHYRNFTCDLNYIPSAIEYIESLGTFGVGLLSAGAVLMTLTLYFAVDACYNVFHQKESVFYKENCMILLGIYPVTSICCLIAAAIPRTQVLTDTVIQVFLMTAFYRLFLLLVDVGRRKMTTPPDMMLRVGPCCCWSCLPFPRLEMTDCNLSRLGILVLQLPIIQILVNCSYLLMSMDQPGLQKQYYLYIEPFAVASILLGMYAITITVRSLQTVAPEAKLRWKVLLSQMVLVFSKLQGSIIKNVGQAVLFPCTPPITPAMYANVTCSALMLIEMMLLSYIARHFYYVKLEGEDRTGSSGTIQATDRSKDNTTRLDLTNNNEPSKQPPRV